MAKRIERNGLTRAEMVANEIRALRGQIGIELAKRSGGSAGMNISLGDIDEEYNPELKTIRGRTQQYERMINDPFVRGQLRNIEMTLVSGVRWGMVDGTQEQQDLVGGNILRQGPPKFWCQQSWYDFLHEGLGMLIYGWSMFGLTRGISDNKMIYTNRKWLHPRSVDENGWIMDEDDRLVEVTRSFTDATGKSYSRQPISAQDLFMMCWDRRGPNWEGTALIRPMFKNWKIGEIAEKIDIIDLQNRGIAIPVAKLSGAGGPKERDTLVEILRTLRGGNKDKAFLVLEKDEALEFLTTQGTAKDARPIIDNQHVGIAKVGGGEYAEIQSASGGRASTSVLATGFFINTDAIRIFFEDKINFGEGPMPGVCESLQMGNFDISAPGFRYTRVAGSKVSPTEQFDNIPLIQDSVKAGLVPPTLKLANETLRRLGWPEMTQQEYNEGMALKAAQPGTPGQPSQAGPDLNPSRGDQLSNAAPEPSRTPPAQPPMPATPATPGATEAATDETDPVARRSLQQSSFGREPTDEEAHVLALGQLDAETRSAEQKYAARIFAWQRREIDQMVAEIKSGRLKAADLLKKNAEASVLKFTNQLANDLKNILDGVKNFGAGQVRDELKRQDKKRLFNENHDELGRFAPGDGGGGGGGGSGDGSPDGAGHPMAAPTESHSRALPSDTRSRLEGYVVGDTTVGSPNLDDLPEHSGDVYRGMRLSQPEVQTLLHSKSVTLREPASASMDRSVAEGFTRDTGGGDPSKDWEVLIHVETKNAARVPYERLSTNIASEFKHQKEVILKPQTKYTPSMVSISPSDKKVVMKWTQK